MNQNLMQSYGDHGLIPNNWPFSSPVCCDSRPDLRQNAGKGSKTVAKGFVHSSKAGNMQSDI